MEAQEIKAQANGSDTKRRAARGRWTPEQRQEIVEASRVPNAAIGEVAKRFAVRPALIAAWRRKQAASATSRSRVARPAQLAAVRLDVGTDGVIEIDLANHCIRVRGIVDATMLREVVAAAR